MNIYSYLYYIFVTFLYLYIIVNFDAKETSLIYKCVCTYMLLIFIVFYDIIDWRSSIRLFGSWKEIDGIKFEIRRRR